MYTLFSDSLTTALCRVGSIVQEFTGENTNLCEVPPATRKSLGITRHPPSQNCWLLSCTDNVTSNWKAFSILDWSQEPLVIHMVYHSPKDPPPPLDTVTQWGKFSLLDSYGSSFHAKCNYHCFKCYKVVGGVSGTMNDN